MSGYSSRENHYSYLQMLMPYCYLAGDVILTLSTCFRLKSRSVSKGTGLLDGYEMDASDTGWTGKAMYEWLSLDSPLDPDIWMTIPLLIIPT